MSSARVTKAQLETAYKAATAGYMQAYGQTQEVKGIGKMCWMGRIDRAYTLLAEAKDEVGQKRMQNGIKTLIGLAETDFIEGEKIHADYVDLCDSLGVAPQAIEPNCQCEYCQRVPNGAELLFAVEVAA